jgi:ATP-dependent exoDNAse (exonuclease V) beta subunit
VHGLLEWSAANAWREPPADLIARFAAAEGLDDNSDAAELLLAPVRAWLGSELFAAQVRTAPRARAEVAILMPLAETVLRGSIDLLVERDGEPPLIVDYKTDRLDGADPADRAARYGTQRDIYALAASEALGAEKVEVAYVFLEQPGRPALTQLDSQDIDAGRKRLIEAIERISLAA